ncbi:MAG TPA: acyltransferase [Dyella sp.]
MLVLMAGVLSIASTGIFRRLDAAPGRTMRRDVTLDGLRSFLALAVVFNHMSMRRAAGASGAVQLPTSHVYFYLGSLGVSIFFMITGYLFWGRLLDTSGRPGWLKLYTHRFFRIVPLYWFLMVAYFAIVFYRAGFNSPVPITEAMGQAMKWLAFGAYPYPPRFLGDARSMLVVGMTWTLFFEWVFYASLLALSVMAKTRWSGVIVVSALILTLYASSGLAGQTVYYVAFFLCGMTAASVARQLPQWHGDGIIRSSIALCLLIGAIALSPTAYSLAGVCLLGLFFLLIASGTSIFGLLLTRGAVRLGHASYSLYLLHGLTLSLIFAPSVLGTYAMSSPLHFWIVAALTMVVLASVAAISYLLIEKRGIAIGHKLLARTQPVALELGRTDSATKAPQ